MTEEPIHMFCERCKNAELPYRFEASLKSASPDVYRTSGCTL